MSSLQQAKRSLSAKCQLPLAIYKCVQQIGCRIVAHHIARCRFFLACIATIWILHLECFGGCVNSTLRFGTSCQCYPCFCHVKVFTVSFYPRSQLSNHPSTFESEDGLDEGAVRSFNHAHMRKAFRLMNELRR